MKAQIAMFKFTLAQGQSIGPSQLQALWVKACESMDVSVGRVPGAGSKEKFVYSLYASQHLKALPQVEMRLRQLLEAHKLHASLIILHQH